MSTEGYVDHIRNARGRQVVLKAQVFAIRSGDSSSPILIFEGKTDVGPYEVWFKRINNSFHYKPLPGYGKQQLLEFRESVESSDDDKLEHLYFIIDNDFDGLKGKKESNNLFCLNRYSIENYLATPEVLKSILEDEFECTGAPENITPVLELFNKVAGEFCSVMFNANFRLYIAATLNLQRKRIENRINKFAQIELEQVLKNHENSELKILIPLETEPKPNTAQIAEANNSFSKIDNYMFFHRGKYILSFFVAWLDLLADARRSGNHPFVNAKNIKYNRVTMTMRSLASRSKIPNGLSEFVDNIGKCTNEICID